MNVHTYFPFHVECLVTRKLAKSRLSLIGDDEVILILVSKIVTTSIHSIFVHVKGCRCQENALNQ